MKSNHDGDAGASERSAALRRLAMQIAVQLPESVADAHIVLRLVKDLLDDFLVESPPRR